MANEQALQGFGQQYLGGGLDPSMMAFLRKFIDEGHLTEAEVGQFIGGTPQAQERRLESQGQQYANTLGRYDQQQLDLAGDSLASRFAKQGRTLGGSSYTAAFSNAARDLAMARQGKIADFYGQGYGNISNAYATQGQAALNRGYGLRDERRQRDWEVEDFYRQQNMYNDYANAAQRKKRNAMFGSLAGAAVGAPFGPIGAIGGSQIGGMIGGGF